MKLQSCFLLYLANLFLIQRVNTGDVEDITEIQRYLKPEKYTIGFRITHKGDQPILSGRMKILVQCLEETNKIIMNARNIEISGFQLGILNVNEAKTTKPKTEIVQREGSYYDKTRPDLYVIQLAENLEKDKYYEVGVGLTADDLLKYSIEGNQILYKFERNWEGHERIEVVSVFGPNGASLIFPCFEETKVKSTLKLSITHWANVTVLSNWPVSRIISYIGRTVPDHFTTEFEETAPIHESGISFAAISFKSTDLLDLPSSSDIPVRIWADEKLIENMAAAKGIATKAMLFYSDYFEAPLYSKKLDIIAIPKFRDGDSEKLGLISLEESSLLYSDEDDGNNQKFFDITRDLCFAISRQWIGTVVTLANPDERYFHHAISFFLEKLCINEANPTSHFNFYDFRNVITFSRTLTPNYRMRLHSEFEPTFNYKLPKGDTQKALHLVRMMISILTESTLQKSLRLYLKTYEHSYSTLEDLWKIFTAEARKAEILDENMSVEEIMDIWTNKSRFPLIRVNVDYPQQTVTISQEPFKFLGEKDEEVEKILWNIPLNYASRTGSKFLDQNTPKWLPGEKLGAFEVNLNSDEWLIVNSQLNVLSHTYFDDKNWELIQNTLLNRKTFLEIDELTRVHLILDMFALAATGIVPYQRVFHTMKYIRHETSELCWTVALTEFDKIYSNLLGVNTTKLLDQFQNYMVEILRPVFNGISYDEDNKEMPQADDLNRETEKSSDQFAALNTDKIQDARSKEDLKFEKLFDQPVKIDEIPQNNRLKVTFKKLFVRSCCKFGVAECEAQSINLYEEWITSVKNREDKIRKIPVEIREVVICQTIKSSPSAHLDMWKLYDKRVTSKKNDIILQTLACSQEENTLREYLNRTLKESYPGDNLKAFMSLSSNRIGYTQMKEFLINNYYEIRSYLNKVNGPHRQPIRLETYFAELFIITTKKEDMDELINFMETKNFGETSENDSLNMSDELLQKSLKVANENILWLDKHQDTLSELL